MSLPKIDSPKFTAKFPDGKEYTFRPFKTKEQKNVNIAAEGGKDVDVINALIDLVDVCTFGKINWREEPLINLEHAFLHIRSKSIGEIVEIQWECHHEHNGERCNHTNVTALDVREAKVFNKKDTVIKVNDDISIVLQYMKVGMLLDFLKDNHSSIQQLRKMTKMVIDGDQTITEFSEEELEEFIDSLPPVPAREIYDFIENQPSLELREDAVCEKCGNTSLINIKGVLNFFA